MPKPCALEAGPMELLGCPDPPLDSLMPQMSRSLAVRVAIGVVTLACVRAGGAFAVGSWIQVGSFGATGSELGQFIQPYDVVVVDELLYVADSNNNRVQVFDLDGQYQFYFGETGTLDGQFRRDRGIGRLRPHDHHPAALRPVRRRHERERARPGRGRRDRLAAALHLRERCR